MSSKKNIYTYIYLQFVPRTSQLSPRTTTCRQLSSSSPAYQHQIEDVRISLSALLSSDVGSCKLGQDVRLCISKLMKADKTAMNFTWVVGHFKKKMPQWTSMISDFSATRSQEVGISLTWLINRIAKVCPQKYLWWLRWYLQCLCWLSV